MVYRPHMMSACKPSQCSTLSLQDKWRNLNMDAFGSRGDKRGSRTKHRAKQRHKTAATAAAASAPSAAQAAMATALSAGPPERVTPCFQMCDA